jgi:hypothetical protein
MQLLPFLAYLAIASPLVAATTPPTRGNNLQQWLAHLPDSKTTQGNVLIGQGPGGNGVSIQVAFSGLPTEGGTFREYPPPNLVVLADGTYSLPHPRKAHQL